MTTPLHLSDPGEIAAALPALLGFVPHESMVLLSLRGPTRGRLGLTVRADLPPEPVTAAVAHEIAHEVACRVARDDPDGVVVALVSEAPDERVRLPGGALDGAAAALPHRGLLHELVMALDELAVPVREALLVRAGRWWNYDCPLPCCAPGAGTPLPAGTSEVMAAAIAAGVVVEPDRAALEARIARGDDGHGADRTDGHQQAAGASWAAVGSALCRCRPGSTARLGDDEVDAVVRALADVDLRDRALGLALGPDAAAAEILWTECTRRAPAPLDAAPATLLAVSAWLRGDGAMANVALERALTSRPGYRLAELLARALAACLPPAALRALITEVVDDDPSPVE